MPYGNKENASRDLFPGALEMMVLESLRRQPAHGYALVQHIQQRSRNLLQVEEGSLYPALQRLLKAKLVRAEWTVSPSTNRRVRDLRDHQSGYTPSGARNIQLRPHAGRHSDGSRAQEARGEFLGGSPR